MNLESEFWNVKFVLPLCTTNHTKVTAENIVWNLLHNGVITDNVTQSPLSNLTQLLWSHGTCVEKPVSSAQVFKLLPDDATKSWTHQSCRDWVLSKSSNNQINVIWVLVNSFQQVPFGLAYVYQALFLCNFCMVFWARCVIWKPAFILALTNATDNRKYSVFF